MPQEPFFRRVLIRIAGAVLIGLLLPLLSLDAGTLRMMSRSRIRNEQGQQQVVWKQLEWKAEETAVVVCDMWQQHWCQGATRRVAEMAPRMNEVLKSARASGVLIVHAPSSCMAAYEGTPMRQLAKNAPVVATEIPLRGWCHLDESREKKLPIDDSDGGCDCQPRCKNGSPWRHQIKTLAIVQGDAVTDSAEAFYLMKQRKIKNVVVMGVHTNMCVLGRPFSIRQMIYQGQNVVLMRDMTDSMYNSRMAPKVPHARGTDLVVQHIEEHWCPTILSTQFTGKPVFISKEDTRPRIAMLIGEQEYNTKHSLASFAADHLEPAGFRCDMVLADAVDGNHFPGIETIASADLLLVSVRRRTLTSQQLGVVKKHIADKKPIIGIRTASHAFALRSGEPPAGRVVWPEFDGLVFGGNYTGHHGNKKETDPKTFVRANEDELEHPILQGVRADEFQVTSWLYKTSPLADTTTTLLRGRVGDRLPVEPVAWTNEVNGQRVFYTSLGHVEDFRQPAFQRLLTNAIRWATSEK